MLLIVSNNFIGYDGCAALAKVVRAPACQLRSIDLSGNRLNDRHVRPFIDAMKRNTTVTSLNPGRNEMQDGTLIRDLLDSNVTLKKLDISWNVFNRAAGVAIAEGLRGNGFLEELYLSFNAI